MQTQRYQLEELAQSNAVLTSSNSAVTAQLSQMDVTIYAMQAQFKTLASTQTNQLISKRNHYCWICRRNFTHGSKTFSQNKAGH